jgi:3-oxoacid CoA-transferase subunit A
MNKLYPDAASALADIVADGQTIAVGGFGLWAFPKR